MEPDSLQLGRERTRFHLGNLRALLAEQLAWLERARDEEDADLREKLEGIRHAVIDVYGDDVWTDADVEFFQEQYGGDDPDDPERVLRLFSDIYPRNVIYSYVMLLTMLTESELLVWCDLLALDRGAYPFNDRSRGPTVDKFQKYLTGKLSLPPLDPSQWEGLRNLMRVRNCIVHAGGWVDRNSNSTLQEIIDREPGLDVTEDAAERTILLVSADYCTAMLEFVRDFFEAVFDSAGIRDDY